MDSKYYTPSWEEFHIGFEYERDYGSGRFKILHYYPTQETLFEIIDHIELEWIRVKYLDKEDIESLGFICTGDTGEEKEFQKFVNDEDNWLLEMSFDNRVIITFEKGFGETTDFVNFDGFIKNKSELKVLLKQLRYVK